MPRQPVPRRSPGGSAATMMTIRRWHGYIGALIAPAVLFFACTGTLQLFSLHEAHDGYHPPVLIEKLGTLHKDQKFEAKPHHDDASPEHDHGPPDAAPGGAPAKMTSADVKSWILKWLFTGVALGLVTSTLFGLYMALQDPRRRRLTLILFAIGAALPVAVLVL